MLGFKEFGYNLIEKYTILMGSMLANIRIERQTDANGSLSMLEVPTMLATKEKMLARLQADPNIDRPYSVLLPRISWEQTGLMYDGDRKLNTVNRRTVKTNDPDKMTYVYNPVPYNLHFKAVVYGKNQSDVNKIVEQIVPFFTPDWTVTMEHIPDMGISHDIPTVLEQADIEDLYSEDFKERRVYTWDLNFVMKGYLYGPERTKPIIKFVNTNLYVYGSNDAVVSMTIQPGLTANGEPTSNASASINVHSIKVDDDYGIVKIITDHVG
jgi:hypothetical protein